MMIILCVCVCVHVHVWLYIFITTNQSNHFLISLEICYGTHYQPNTMYLTTLKHIMLNVNTDRLLQFDDVGNNQWNLTWSNRPVC